MNSRIDSKVFSRTFKESLAAYTFDIGGIFAGFIFYSFVISKLDSFQVPWIIAVYPTILSAKGTIGGLLSGRLSTALHVGTIYPRFLNNTKTFYKLFDAVVFINLETCIIMGLISLVFGSLFWGISTVNFSEILSVVVATMALGLFISLITMFVAFTSFKKGLDPDITVYPIMSTVADITITVCYAIILHVFFFADSFGKYTVAAIAIAFAILACYILIRNIHEEGFVKTIREFSFTLIAVAFIVNITGTFLHMISGVILTGRSEIYTVYPALIDLVGDVGSVVGSTATTKLALGLLKPSFSSIKGHLSNISGAWAASLAMFTVLSMLSLSINNVLSLFWFFTATLLIANVIAVSLIILISYATAILTFHKGLDPDNFIIPIESSLADAVTSVALLVALIVCHYSL
ncbi:MAG: magnesium transporter [Candidatus Bathyarchaeia archaeon]